MIILPSIGLCPSNMKNGLFQNLAGPQSPEKDKAIESELRNANIEIIKLDFLSRRNREVQTSVMGECGPWSFERAWYYWVAEGPGIPPSYAESLHSRYGRVVRVAGHCCCPSPLEWFKGFAVGLYHVDTAEGLIALADTIRKIMGDANQGL